MADEIAAEAAAGPSDAPPIQLTGREADAVACAIRELEHSAPRSTSRPVSELVDEVRKEDELTDDQGAAALQGPFVWRRRDQGHAYAVRPVRARRRSMRRRWRVDVQGGAGLDRSRWHRHAAARCRRATGNCRALECRRLCLGCKSLQRVKEATTTATGTTSEGRTSVKIGRRVAPRVQLQACGPGGGQRRGRKRRRRRPQQRRLPPPPPQGRRWHSSRSSRRRSSSSSSSTSGGGYDGGEFGGGGVGGGQGSFRVLVLLLCERPAAAAKPADAQSVPREINPEPFTVCSYPHGRIDMHRPKN